MLIALIAAVVAAVGFYATQGSRDTAEDAPVEVTQTSTPEKAAPKAEKQAKSAAGKPAKPTRKAATNATDRAARSQERREAAAGVPRGVQRALDARKLVVLFFYKPGSADDEATARSVAALRGPKVAVFSDPVDGLAKYRNLIGSLGISQAPAVVIVKRDRTARVLQGYIDPATLAQDVADAR